MTIEFKGAQKRIYVPEAAYFITVKTRNNEPFFKEPILCDLFVENLRVCKRLKEFTLYGWVIVYDHVHLMIEPSRRFNHSKIMQFLKRHVTRDINCVFGYAREGAIRESRLQLGFQKFAPEIRRLELGVIRARLRFIIKYNTHESFEIFRWQKSFHDHYCRNRVDFETHLKYIVDNVDHHPLPKDWPYIFTNEKYFDLLDYSE